ncbi:hypothetical protein HYV85_03480 [Candidatus Woesearchaeota archaeon]|nr:hypothetical protein [Candidatus Woesearchaeota archaeon]
MKPSLPIIVTDSGDLHATDGRGSEAHKIEIEEAALTLKRYGLNTDVSWYIAVRRAPSLPAEVQASLHLFSVQLGVAEEVERLPPRIHHVFSVAYSSGTRIGNFVSDAQLPYELKNTLLMTVCDLVASPI